MQECLVIVASHQWTSGEKELYSSKPSEAAKKEMAEKALGFCRVIKKYRRDIKYLWIDSLCMSRDPRERANAVVNMFNWYRNAEACYTYLWDVKDKMTTSAWFTRGWTLQELLAPKQVVFFNIHWQLLGHKCPGSAMECGHTIYGPAVNVKLTKLTHINREVLKDFEQVRNLKFLDIIKWMAGRATTEEEDLWYSLIGIFGVYIEPDYGEGFLQARRRLCEALLTNTFSTTHLGTMHAWSGSSASWYDPPIQVEWHQDSPDSTPQRRIRHYETQPLTYAPPAFNQHDKIISGMEMVSEKYISPTKAEAKTEPSVQNAGASASKSKARQETYVQRAGSGASSSKARHEASAQRSRPSPSSSKATTTAPPRTSQAAAS